MAVNIGRAIDLGFKCLKSENEIVKVEQAVTREFKPVLNSLVQDTVEIGRFASEQGKEARRMNEMTVRQLRAGKVTYTYPEATPEDLERLTSSAYKHTFRRVTWTNPDDGKVYHLLKDARTPDGNVVIRILDENGKFIKNATIKPQNVVIIDDAINKEALTYSKQVDISHGNAVRKFAKRNNPFVNYRFIEIGDNKSKEISNDLVIQELKKILGRIEKGEKIDIISCSWGTEADLAGLNDLLGKDFSEATGAEIKAALVKLREEEEEGGNISDYWKN